MIGIKECKYTNENNKKGDTMIRVGDLNIKVLSKEFYCRNCEKFSPWCKQNHRYGLYFLLEIENVKTNKRMNVVLGEGEIEGWFPFNVDPGDPIHYGMSGCEVYKKGHITCSGWYSIETPYFIEDPDNENITNTEVVEITNSEKVELMRMLNDSILKILLRLIKEEIISIDSDLGVYEMYKPVIKVYVRDRTKYYALDGRITEIPYSFSSKFQFGNIEIIIKKQDYREFIDDNGHVTLLDKDNYTRIDYRLQGKRRMAILAKDDYVEGIYQEYNEKVIKVIPSIRIQYYYSIEVFGPYLITADTEFEGRLEKITNLEEAGIKLVNGKFEDSKLKGNIILYSPEYGIIELNRNKEYTIYKL